MWFRFIFICLVSFPTLANAQSVRIKKVKGEKALAYILNGSLVKQATYNLKDADTENETTVMVTRTAKNRAVLKRISGSDLQGGRTYHVIEKAGTDEDYDHRLREIRKLIGGNLTFQRQEIEIGDFSATSSIIQATGLYGKRNIKNAYGGIGSIMRISSGGFTSGALLAGGFYDHNFVDDIPANKVVYSVRGTACAGIPLSDDDSSFGVYVSPRFVTKWYGFSENLAIAGDIGYDYFKWFGADDSITTNGISMGIGFLAIY